MAHTHLEVPYRIVLESSGWCIADVGQCGCEDIRLQHKAGITGGNSEIGKTTGRRNQMSVAINKPWQDHFARSIYLFSRSRFGEIFDTACGAHARDDSIHNQYGAVFYHPELAQSIAPARTWRSVEGKQLACSPHQEASFHACLVHIF